MKKCTTILLLLAIVVVLTACPDPVTPNTPNDGAALSSLSITGLILSPAFQANVTTYTAEISRNTTPMPASIVVAATASNQADTITVGNSSAQGSISENVNVIDGNNTINVTVKNTDSSTEKVYTITVFKPQVRDLIINCVESVNGSNLNGVELSLYEGETLIETKTASPQAVFNITPSADCKVIANKDGHAQSSLIFN